MIEGARRILRVIGALEAGELVAGDDARAHAKDLRDLLAGDSDPFDLKRAPGQRTVSSQLALAERDHLLRKIAHVHFGHLKPSERPDAICGAIRRYFCGEWQAGHRQKDICPKSIAGSMRGDLWALLRLKANPLSPRHIAEILAASSGFSPPKR